MHVCIYFNEITSPLSLNTLGRVFANSLSLGVPAGFLTAEPILAMLVGPLAPRYFFNSFSYPSLPDGVLAAIFGDIFGVTFGAAFGEAFGEDFGDGAFFATLPFWAAAKPATAAPRFLPFGGGVGSSSLDSSSSSSSSSPM